MINVLINISSSYIFPAKVMLHSLMINNEFSIDIYILHCALSESDLTDLKDFVHAEGKKYRLIPVKVKSTCFSGVPIGYHFSVETLLGLLAMDVLPKEVNKVLYLNVDMIVDGSIENLCQMSFGGKSAIVCRDEEISNNNSYREIYNNLNIPFEDPIFNAGMILYDFATLKQKHSVKEFLDYISNNIDKLTYLDQDVLNSILHNELLYVENKYNRAVGIIKNRKQEQEVRKETIIYHYCGRYKPWNYKDCCRCNDIFWKYAKDIAGNKAWMKYVILNPIYCIYNKIQKIMRVIFLKLINIISGCIKK